MKPQTTEKLAKVFIWTGAVLTVGLLLVIMIYIFSQGISRVDLGFLLDKPKRMGSEGGVFPAILGTAYFTLISLAIATPIGVGAAIYLVEYTQKGRLKEVIGFAVDSLNAVPSIVFGLFGYAFFVKMLGAFTGGWSLLSGSLTGALMILPTIIRSSEEAIKAVPDEYREGSFALGATKGQTVRRVVVPDALPGIITGVILGIGRVVGETAALLLTLGGSLNFSVSLMAPARTLSLHLYLVAMEIGAMDMAFATASVLMILVMAINMTTNFFIRRIVGNNLKEGK